MEIVLKKNSSIKTNQDRVVIVGRSLIYETKKKTRDGLRKKMPA